MNETRKLYGDDLRQLCIKKNWYTLGTNEEYRNLLDFADVLENITTYDIVVMSKDILSHSNTEYTLSSVCFEIAEICHSFFE